MLTRILPTRVKDANNIKCEGCEDETATMHCADCGQNMGESCLTVHSRLRATSSHQLIPLLTSPRDQAGIKKEPRCHHHPMLDIDTYCMTCKVAVCPKCVASGHSCHSFTALADMENELKNDIADFTIAIRRREQEAKEAVAKINSAFDRFQGHRRATEDKVAEVFDSVVIAVEQRRAEVLQTLQDRDDALRKTNLKAKEDAESTATEFWGYCNFTEGLLTQGTPFEIAASQSEVSLVNGWQHFELFHNSTFVFLLGPSQIQHPGERQDSRWTLCLIFFLHTQRRGLEESYCRPRGCRR